MFRGVSNFQLNLIVLGSMALNLWSVPSTFAGGTPSYFFPAKHRHLITGKGSIIAVLDDGFTSSESLLDGYDSVQDSALVTDGRPGHGTGCH
jgi:hypothetical protein